MASPNYQQLAQQDAIAAGIDPTLFVAQINQESGFNPNALSPAGAEGIAQFMPGTARGLGVNPWDPVASLKAAAGLMGVYLKRFGNEPAALSAYNYGPAGTYNAINQYGSAWDSHVPTETQNYISNIMGAGPGNGCNILMNVYCSLPTAAGSQECINCAATLTGPAASVLQSTQTIGTVASSSPNNSSVWDNITQFFTTIGQANTWIKIAFIVAGVIILLVGIHKLL